MTTKTKTMERRDREKERDRTEEQNIKRHVYGRLKTIYGYESIARVAMCFFNFSMLAATLFCYILTVFDTTTAGCAASFECEATTGIKKMQYRGEEKNMSSWKCSIPMSSMMNVHKLRST